MSFYKTGVNNVFFFYGTKRIIGGKQYLKLIVIMGRNDDHLNIYP